MADILDQYGNPVGWSRNNGHGRTDFYDLQGNFTGYSIADGDTGRALQYDADGNHIGSSFTDADGNITYYDAQGREMRWQNAEPEALPERPPGPVPDKLTTKSAIKALLIPSPEFDSISRNESEDTGEAVLRYILAAALPVITLLLAKVQLPYTILLGVDTVLAFFISRSCLKQKLLTGLIFVNTIYTMVVSCIYSQFLWTFPLQDAGALQYLVIVAFFVVGLIFVWKIETKGYFSYPATRPLQTLFFLALSVAWFICMVTGSTADTMRYVLNIILIIQGVYSLFVIMNRLVELVNTVRSKSGIAESTRGQMVRYVLYILLFFGIRMFDRSALLIVIVLLAASAAAFFLSRLNILNRFRLSIVVVNSLYSLILLACYITYLIHLYEWRPSLELVLYLFMLGSVLFLSFNLEQEDFASFRFTKLVSMLLLAAPAVLYAAYRLHIAQDFTWGEIVMLMKYILLGGAVFSAVVIVIQLIAGRKKKPVPVEES